MSLLKKKKCKLYAGFIPLSSHFCLQVKIKCWQWATMGDVLKMAEKSLTSKNQFKGQEEITCYGLRERRQDSHFWQVTFFPGLRLSWKQPVTKSWWGRGVPLGGRTICSNLENTNGHLNLSVSKQSCSEWLLPFSMPFAQTLVSHSSTGDTGPSLAFPGPFFFLVIWIKIFPLCLINS